MQTKSQPVKNRCAFNLYNKQAGRELLIQFNSIAVNYNFSPKYLEVIVDRSLIFKKHLESVEKKVRSTLNLLQKLARTG